MSDVSQKVADTLADKVLALIGDQFISVCAAIAIGWFVSVLWTNFFKPAMKLRYTESAVRRMKIRAHAFGIAALVTAAVCSLLLRGPQGPQAVTALIAALTAGLGSPLAYDLFWYAAGKLFPGARWSASKAGETHEFQVPPTKPDP